jgi:hypothetical protein
MTPWTGDQPVARPLHTHKTTQTQNKRTDTHASSGIRTSDPSFWAGEDGSCLRPRCHCDRLILLHFHWKRKSLVRGMLSECLFWSVTCYAYWFRGTRVRYVVWCRGVTRTGEVDMLFCGSVWQPCSQTYVPCSIVNAWKEDQVTDIQHVAKDEGRGCSLSLCRVNRRGWMLQGDYYHSTFTKLHAARPLNESSLLPPSAYHSIYSVALPAFALQRNWLVCCCNWRRAASCRTKLP